MKSYLLKAMLLGLAASASQIALADPIDAAAMQRAKQIRDDIAAKQKALEEAQRAEPQKVATPTEPLQLPIDDTDSPGATQQ